MTIDGGASLREAARVMNDARLHRLVAIDAHGRPIGVIAAMDFVALAAEGLIRPSGGHDDQARQMTTAPPRMTR